MLVSNSQEKAFDYLYTVLLLKSFSDYSINALGFKNLLDTNESFRFTQSSFNMHLNRALYPLFYRLLYSLPIPHLKKIESFRSRLAHTSVNSK